MHVGHHHGLELWSTLPDCTTALAILLLHAQHTAPRIPMSSTRPLDVLADLPLTATAASILLGVIFFGCLLNIKNIPLMWHARLISAVLYHSRFKQSGSMSPDCEGGVPAIFCSIATKSRSPLYECYLNIHKSDSTYFSDLDISRFHLLAKLFKGIFNHFLYQEFRREKISLALGGTCCIFRREIKPYALFEIHSRALSWDHKWLYIISHFVEPGSYQKFRDGRATLDEQANENSAGPSEGKFAWKQEHGRRAVYASAISQRGQEDRGTRRGVENVGTHSTWPGRDGSEC